MACGCEQVAPCRVPELVAIPTYSESHALVLDPQFSSERGSSPVTLAVGIALLVVALSRHFRSQPLIVLDLASRAVVPSGPLLRSMRSADRRPFRLVLSTRERAALARVRETIRRAWTITAARLLPSRFAEAVAPIRS
jgi:hypothetical protein